MLEGALEAILFASGESISAERLAQALEVEQPLVDRLIERLRDKYERADSALEVLRLGDAYQLCTKAQYAPYVKKALDIRRNVPLSQAAMEVLSIIAYNQPVTRSFVEQIRGIDSSSVVSSLVEKGLVEEAGRLELPGRPIAYRTTANFLRCFGVSSIDELPQPRRQEEQAEGPGDGVEPDKPEESLEEAQS
ncbi:SMC-Scp complex subunit ScpB [Oscillospiraceae bacterium NSJ-54]|uniref:Segregation and condensation protein B n=2 Tax=Zongyangia hominis TaxID=2763677 RepID=A0A926IC78_9FIRM|nr:SMC-Scp complex subunit ScpB [Zongyangia hominis]